MNFLFLKKFYIQGYEPQAILYLLNREIDPFLEIKIKETDIIVGKDAFGFDIHRIVIFYNTIFL